MTREFQGFTWKRLHLHSKKESQEQIAANVKVIKASSGLLAPVNGSERHLSLGTGHAAAFVKAANHGCRTPISYIQDMDGNINLLFLKMQKHYKIMLEQGWMFTQLPWQVEAAWPNSPDVLQRALNSTSEVHSAVTELEGAVTIAECLESGDDEETAIATATSGSPTWASYAQLLAQLAKQYGGGKKVPLLHKLDGFAKKHGENRRLGEEFLQAVVNGFKYADPSIQLPRIVDMLLTTNMVSQRLVDGVARCLTKTDVSSLGGNKRVFLLQTVENHLEEAEAICNHLLANHPDTLKPDSDIAEKISNIEGLFKVRLGAHICKKGKQTFERKDWASVDDIVRAFCKEVHGMIDGVDGCQLPLFSSTWVTIVAGAKADAEEEKMQTSKVELMTVERLKSTEEAAKRKGYKQGSMIFEKAVGLKAGLYEIIVLGDECELAERDSFKPVEALRNVKVSFDTLWKNWITFSGVASVRLDVDWSGHAMWKQTDGLLELSKAKLFEALFDHANDNPVTPQDVVLCIKPVCLRANRDFKTQELVLVPCVPHMANLTITKGSGLDLDMQVGSGQTKLRFFVVKPSQPTKAFDEWKHESVNPFWGVGSTHNQADANLKYQIVKIDDISFQVLTTRRSVKKMDVLQYYKEALVATPLKDATSVETKADEGATGEPPAAPKKSGAAAPSKRLRVR